MRNKGFRSLLFFTLLAIVCGNVAMASEMVEVKTEKKINVWAYDRRGNHLVVISPIGAGSSLRYDLSKLKSGVKYKKSSGSIVTHDGKWATNVKLDWVPGSRISSSTRSYWNSLGLFVMVKDLPKVEVSEPEVVEPIEEEPVSEEVVEDANIAPIQTIKLDKRIVLRTKSRGGSQLVTMAGLEKGVEIKIDTKKMKSGFKVKGSNGSVSTSSEDWFTSIELTSFPSGFYSESKRKAWNTYDLFIKVSDIEHLLKSSEDVVVNPPVEEPSEEPTEEPSKEPSEEPAEPVNTDIVELTLNEDASLRQMENGGLRTVMTLPKGTKITYLKNNEVGAQYYYPTPTSSSKKKSRSGWYKDITIEELPSSVTADEKEKILGLKDLYLSVTNKYLKAPNKFLKEIYACYSKFIEEPSVKVEVLDKLLDYLYNNQSSIENQEYVAYGDFDSNYRTKRFFLFNLKTCEVTRRNVAHGKYSGSIGGKVTKCIHSSGSSLRKKYHKRYGMTRPGFIKIKGIHWTKMNWPLINSSKNKALALYGLEESSSDVRRNGVVMHESYSAGSSYRSLGCPAMDQGKLKLTYKKLIKGTLFLSHSTASTCQ